MKIYYNAITLIETLEKKVLSGGDNEESRERGTIKKQGQVAKKRGFMSSPEPFIRKLFKENTRV